MLASLRRARSAASRGRVDHCRGPRSSWRSNHDSAEDVGHEVLRRLPEQPARGRSHTPDMVREAVENTDVLYYAEGVESIVSVIKVKGGEQSFVTNGRVEASSHLQAQQCQFTLGHLPMLLNANPKDVLVVGMGSGMTAGATAVHPRRRAGHARRDRAAGHRRRQDVRGVQPPRRSTTRRSAIVLNDGRNFLMTTNKMFDVITADPIHPWFRGAGYLYTDPVLRARRGPPSTRRRRRAVAAAVRADPAGSRVDRQDVPGALPLHADVAHPLRRRDRRQQLAVRHRRRRTSSDGSTPRPSPATCGGS